MYLYTCSYSVQVGRRCRGIGFRLSCVCCTAAPDNGAKNFVWLQLSTTLNPGFVQDINLVLSFRALPWSFRWKAWSAKGKLYYSNKELMGGSMFTLSSCITYVVHLFNYCRAWFWGTISLCFATSKDNTPHNHFRQGDVMRSFHGNQYFYASRKKKSVYSCAQVKCFRVKTILWYSHVVLACLFSF
jgi:hypothetical protein